jgi:hypothetical protein
MSRKLFSLIAASAVLLARPARADLWGADLAPLAALVAQGADAISQAQQFVSTAKEDLQIARDVYAGVSDFVNFDPNTFLSGQQNYWLAQVPLVGDVSGLVNDVATRGLTGGHFNATQLYYRLNVYRDAQRTKAAFDSLGGRAVVLPYDSTAALNASKEIDTVLSNPAARQRVAGAPDPDTVSEGLFEADAARVDPALVSLYLQRRAGAKEAEYQAYKLYTEALGASPGKAQQIAAMAAALTAQEAARIDDRLSQFLAVQQLGRQEAAVGRALERSDSEFLWGDMTTKTLKAPHRGSLEIEPLQ